MYIGGFSLGNFFLGHFILGGFFLELFFPIACVLVHYILAEFNAEYGCELWRKVILAQYGHKPQAESGDIGFIPRNEKIRSNYRNPSPSRTFFSKLFREIWRRHYTKADATISSVTGSALSAWGI